MDTKLATYRSKKRKKAMIEFAKHKFEEILSWKKIFNTRSQETPNSEDEDRVKLQPQDSDDQESILSDDIDTEPSGNSVITWTVYFLYFLLWVTLYVLAIKIEFGAVYFILSCFVLIWVNTRSGPKKRGEVSAYSVFNPDCQAIDGTLKAEQLERQLLYGVASIH